VESKLVPLGTSAIYWLIVPAPGYCEDGKFGGMKIGRGHRSTRIKPAAAALFPPQIPLDKTRARTRVAAVGKPATNRLSYCAAFPSVTKKIVLILLFKHVWFLDILIMTSKLTTTLHKFTFKVSASCTKFITYKVRRKLVERYFNRLCKWCASEISLSLIINIVWGSSQ
jgi:hypothetical protein